MRRLALRPCALAFALLCARVAEAAPPERPKLVVFLVVDQMKAEYVEQYGRNWKAGLRRLFDGGAWFRNAAYPFLNTITCPGHATLGTGTYPHLHGMVLNGWYDRQSHRSIDCTDDPEAPIIGFAVGRTETPHWKGGDSGRNLLVPALPD